MRLSDLLHDLQDIDTRLDGARGSLNQIRRQLGDRSALDLPTQELAHAREALHQIEAAERDLELETESRRSKIASDEKKLYGGSVTNPKELGSLQDEVNLEKRAFDRIETRLLELLEERDLATQRRNELQTALDSLTEHWNTQQEQAHRRADELERDAGDLEQRREALIGQVAGPARSTYDTLRRQKGGVAVAPVLQRTCQACRVGLTPAIEQRARIGAELVLCHSCGRILYVAIS